VFYRCFRSYLALLDGGSTGSKHVGENNTQYKMYKWTPSVVYWTGKYACVTHRKWNTVKADLR